MENAFTFRDRANPALIRKPVDVKYLRPDSHDAVSIG